MPLRLAVTFSIRAVARVWNDPRPVRYASRTYRPAARSSGSRGSGPGTNRISSSSVASGWATRCRAAVTTSTRLCGAMLVAIPTAIPDATLEELMRFVPGPDLPTGGKIVGLEAVREAYRTGRGSFHTRATARIENVTAKRKG